jgi:hypothetical protein
VANRLCGYYFGSTVVVGWVAEKSLWVARVRDRRGDWATAPMALAAAKREAVDRVNGRAGVGKRLVSRYPLNSIQAGIIDGAAA